MKKLPKGQCLEVMAKLEAAGLNRSLAQKIVTAVDNSLAKKMVGAIQTESSGPTKEINSIDLTSRFEKIAQFKFIIPNDYSLRSFREKYKNVFQKFDSNLTDANFRLSQPLQYGQTKMVTIYRIIQKTTGRDSLTFAKQRGKQLPNVALAAIWEQNPEAFGRRLWFVGLDEEKFLYQQNSTAMMPILGHDINGKPCFDLLPVTEMLEPGFCIVVMN
jgi:hypothetical protein